MGGKGTFAVGKSVPFSYKTVSKIEGVKVFVSPSVPTTSKVNVFSDTSGVVLSLHEVTDNAIAADSKTRISKDKKECFFINVFIVSPFI